jgi:poly(glycerol-phosphate) alpha-glucosyltransferase
MGRRGLELVQRQFTWESVGRQMHEVYQWLLGGGTPPACVGASS